MPNEATSVATLDPNIEQEIMSSVKQTEQGAYLTIYFTDAKQLRYKLIHKNRIVFLHIFNQVLYILPCKQFPIIRLRDNIQLNPNQYIIKIKGIQITEGEILFDHYMAMTPGYVEEEILGNKHVAEVSLLGSLGNENTRCKRYH